VVVREPKLEVLLDLQDVVAGYGKGEVLHGVTLQVLRGEIVTLLGANGAGKTTTLRTIFGFAALKSGMVSFKDRNLTGLPAHKIVALGISYVPQDNKVFPSLTVRENLEMGAYSVSRLNSARNFARVLDLFPRLGERLTQRARTLSGGERQMLGIARSLMTDPEMLVLDEPSLGLAPQLVVGLFEKIREVHSAGVTVLLVEQNAQRSLEIAHRAYVMEFGQIRIEGLAEQLLRDDEVRRSYLGEE
jgi:branched-chain amino acid transport system ATP-binding protein